MEGILCAIDQHAADKRIGLERLEDAVLKKVSSIEAGDEKKIMLNLSKMESISSDDLIKYVPLSEPKQIHLSTSQLETIRSQKKTNNQQLEFHLCFEQKLHIINSQQCPRNL